MESESDEKTEDPLVEFTSELHCRIKGSLEKMGIEVDESALIDSVGMLVDESVEVPPPVKLRKLIFRKNGQIVSVKSGNINFKIRNIVKVSALAAIPGTAGTAAIPPQFGEMILTDLILSMLTVLGATYAVANEFMKQIDDRDVALLVTLFKLNAEHLGVSNETIITYHNRDKGEGSSLGWYEVQSTLDKFEDLGIIELINDRWHIKEKPLYESKWLSRLVAKSPRLKRKTRHSVFNIES